MAGIFTRPIIEEIRPFKIYKKILTKDSKIFRCLENLDGYFIIDFPGHEDKILFLKNGTSGYNTMDVLIGMADGTVEGDNLAQVPIFDVPEHLKLDAISKMMQHHELRASILDEAQSLVTFQGFSGHFTKMYANLLVGDRSIRFIGLGATDGELEVVETRGFSVGVFGDRGHISAVSLVTERGMFLFDTEGTTHQYRSSDSPMYFVSSLRNGLKITSLNPFGLRFQGSSKSCAVWSAHIASEIYKCRNIGDFLIEIGGKHFLRANIIMRAAAGVSQTLGEDAVLLNPDPLPLPSEYFRVILGDGEVYYITKNKNRSRAVDIESLIFSVPENFMTLEQKIAIINEHMRPGSNIQLLDLMAIDKLQKLIVAFSAIGDINLTMNHTKINEFELKEIMSSDFILSYVPPNSRVRFRELLSGEPMDLNLFTEICKEVFPKEICAKIHSDLDKIRPLVYYHET